MGNQNYCGRRPQISEKPLKEEEPERLPPKDESCCCCRRNKSAYHQLEDADQRSSAVCVVCCICLFSFVVIVFLVVPAVGGYYLVEKHSKWAEQTYVDCPGYPKSICTEADGKLLTPANYTRYLAWNGCKQGFKDDAALSQCASPCLTAELLSAIGTYNSQNSFKLVEFPSRAAPDGQKSAILRAWWLPSTAPNAPRVVLQHGNNANANSRMVVFAAYLLRSFGVDVLIPSLRSHGLSQPGFDKVTWSYEYVFDVLGAWDYAVKDPDGVLGGSRPPSKVGLMGFSMGAYLVTSALGIDANVPAVWADGGVWTVNGMAKSTVAPYLGPLAVVVAPIMTWFAKLWAGVDITKNSPPEMLPLGPDTRRKVAVVTSTLDSFVPPEETFRFSDFVESNPTKYELVLKLAMPTICNGNAHCSVEFVHPIQYREQLFIFWDKVFNLGAGSGLSMSSLPSLTRRLRSGEETSDYIEPASVFV